MIMNAIERSKYECQSPSQLRDSTFTFCGKKIKKCLFENNLIEEIKIINGKVQIVNSKDFFDLGLEGMKKDKNFFVKVN